MVKRFISILMLLSLVFVSACNTRTKVEPCDFSYAISCAAYSASQEDFQTCLETLGGESCSLSDDEFAEVSASLSRSITEYTCHSMNPYVEALTEAGHSVTHTPDFTLNQNYFYVDPFHGLLADYENFSVTRTIGSAIDLAAAGDVIVLCPGEYFENIDISGEAKDDLTFLNIAGGTLAMAEYTQIAGELGSVVEINGSKGISFKGLTFKNGSSSLLYDSGFGGGIFISVLREDVTYSDAIQIQNSFIQDNTALYAGGGLYVEGNVDVRLADVTFARNKTSLGFGGALALEGGFDEQSKTVFCNNCTFAQNQSYLWGTAISVKGSDMVALQNTELTLNNGLSEMALGAVALDVDALFYSFVGDWGQGSNENTGFDIVLLRELEEGLGDFAGDIWQSLQAGNLTGNELETLYNNLLDEDGNLPGSYDYVGVLSNVCQYGSYAETCEILYATDADENLQR